MTQQAEQISLHGGRGAPFLFDRGLSRRGQNEGLVISDVFIATTQTSHAGTGRRLPSEDKPYIMARVNESDVKSE